MWALLAGALAFPAIAPSSLPPPGLYACRGLMVHVYNPAFACVHFDDDIWTVHHDRERGLVLDEPLASRARQMGLSDVSCDGDALAIRFDGRFSFRLRLERVSDAPR